MTGCYCLDHGIYPISVPVASAARGLTCRVAAIIEISKPLSAIHVIFVIKSCRCHELICHIENCCLIPYRSLIEISTTGSTTISTAVSDFRTHLAAHQSGRCTGQPVRMGSDTATPSRECGNCKSGNCSPGTRRWKPYHRRWGISGRKLLRPICDDKRSDTHGLST